MLHASSPLAIALLASALLLSGCGGDGHSSQSTTSSILQFDTSTLDVNEAVGTASVSVTRTGSTTMRRVQARRTSSRATRAASGRSRNT
jgi:hypothetical protein